MSIGDHMVSRKLTSLVVAEEVVLLKLNDWVVSKLEVKEWIEAHPLLLTCKL